MLPPKKNGPVAPTSERARYHGHVYLRVLRVIACAVKPMVKVRFDRAVVAVAVAVLVLCLDCWLVSFQTLWMTSVSFMFLSRLMLAANIIIFEEKLATAVSRETRSDLHIANLYTTIDELTHTMVNPSGPLQRTSNLERSLSRGRVA